MRRRTPTSKEQKRAAAIPVFEARPGFYNPKTVVPYEPHKGVLKIIEEGALERSREFLEAFNNTVNHHTGFVVKQY